MALAEVRDTPLSVDEVMHAVVRPAAGAVVTFVGTVRETNDGRAVTLLEYSAYVSMANREMGAIVAELESEYPAARLAVVHRVGALAVGDLAVVCAASAPHRDAAFRSCRALIDRIKERAPIWKREAGPDGVAWAQWDEVPKAK